MTADLPSLPIFLHATGCPGSLPASDTGPLLSPLTSYTVVLTLALDAEQPSAGDPSALSDPELVQPLLLGLAEALPALRGACNALHSREVWQLLLHVGAIFKFAGQRCSSAAQQLLLRSTAQQGGPVLIKLVRDVAAALPSSPPADVPHDTVTSVRIGLCSALTLLSLPDSESSGGSSEADSLPLSPADWSALEAFSLLSPAICQAASPPSQLRNDLLLEAGHVLCGAVLRIWPLLQRVAISCTAQQLQLVFDVAWQAGSQLPLLVCGAATAATPTEQDLGKLGLGSLTLLDQFIQAALQWAASTRSGAGSSGRAPSQVGATAAAAAATELLQRTHDRLCKMVHFMAGTSPPEQLGVQAALRAANPALSCVLAQCYNALQLVCARSGGRDRQQAGEGAQCRQQAG